MVEYITYKVDTNVHVHCMVDYMYNELHYTWWITLCMVDYIMYDELHYTWWITYTVDYMYDGLQYIMHMYGVLHYTPVHGGLHYVWWITLYMVDCIMYGGLHVWWITCYLQLYHG